MSEATASSMAHARDDEDSRYLEEGNHAALLAKYQPVILGRCIARLRGDAAAEDVAQDVMLRLVAELRRGKRYPVPYRVVVHQVIGWTIADHFNGRPTDVALPDSWAPVVPDATEEIDERRYLHALFDDLGERTRAVFELRYLVGLSHDQIAERLGMERNAVDQALNRGHKKLREVLANE